MRIALTIAGSDPSGGAGIQADLKTFSAHGVFGMSAITAVTVQNTQKVYDIQEISPDIVYNQITRLFEDTPIHVVKIGMVSSSILVETIADALATVELPPVVLDPVMISKSGFALLQEDAQSALIEKLFPIADIVTPNIFEAEQLSGLSIKTVGDMKQAAEAMIELGPKGAVIKGGHMEADSAIDVLYNGEIFKEISSSWVDTKNTHGTGCTFSSALAANMALGRDFFESASIAKRYITSAIAQAPSIGKGSGPLNHMISFETRC